MKESVIVKKIRDHLKKKYGAECFKHHGGPFAESGVSDLVCSMPSFGRALFIEVKVPGKIKNTTVLQTAFLSRMAKTGAVAGVVASIEDVDKLLTVNQHAEPTSTTKKDT